MGKIRLLVITKLAKLVDLFFSPLTYLAITLLRFIRKFEIKDMRLSKVIFRKVGIFPIRDHYYEPFFMPRYLKFSLKDDRFLPGIDLNIGEQLTLMNKFKFNNELLMFPLETTAKLEYYYHNGYFESGDSEYLYNIIRLSKPKRIIEIGSGYSTLMAINAINKNKQEDSGYRHEHICIDPYAASWLENLNIQVIRKRVEEIDRNIFYTLGFNDILFIDSSHIIRPQGDVLFEFLAILPMLKPGVFVHAHDIFTPKDYPDKWITEAVTFWNEQYLLEAFLTLNKEFEVVAALNYLKNNYFMEISNVCPVLKNESHHEPGSFWMRRKFSHD